MFLQSSWQLPALINKATEGSELKKGVKVTDDASSDGSQSADSLSSHVKVQIVSCCLLVEILNICPDIASALRVIQVSMLLLVSAVYTGKYSVTSAVHTGSNIYV